MGYPEFETWNEARVKLSCFKCGSKQHNFQESTRQNGGPANATGDGEHRSQCGVCGLFTYFDVAADEQERK